jgi:hypothetical protein
MNLCVPRPVLIIDWSVWRAIVNICGSSILNSCTVCSLAFGHAVDRLGPDGETIRRFISRVTVPTSTHLCRISNSSETVRYGHLI